MIPEPASLLACLDPAIDPGLWFIFYSDDEGVAAIDLTREHPDIGYKNFESTLNFADTTPETEKLVLLGGPERPDDALVILHETAAAAPDSHRLNDEFSFLSYNYVLLPGHPPRLTTPDNRPSEIRLKRPSGLVIAMGYRVFDTPAITAEIKAGRWLCLPATPAIVFHTHRRERRAGLLGLMN